MRWRNDGRELFYVTRSGDLMAVEITVHGDTLDAERAQRLFGGVQTVDGPHGYASDVALDGTKFIVAEGVEGRNAAPQALTLVENWTGLLSMSSSP